MFPTTIVKFVASTVVSIGVSKIVGNAIKATTPDNLKTYERVCIRAGKYALVGACASFAARHVESQVEDLAEVFAKTMSLSDAVKKAWVDDVEHEAAKNGDTQVTIDITTTPRNFAEDDDETSDGHKEPSEDHAEAIQEFLDNTKTNSANAQS